MIAEVSAHGRLESTSVNRSRLRRAGPVQSTRPAVKHILGNLEAKGPSVRNRERTRPVQAARLTLLALALAMVLPIAPPGAAADEPVGEEEARDIAVDAYVCF